MPLHSREKARPPLIGITADATPDKFILNRAYVRMIRECGGLPLILPCIPERAVDYAQLCDGFVLTGGDDPLMEAWGIPMHPKATPVHPDRQAFELALLDALNAEHRKPTLGICLGMQFMGLHAGGKLDQHLPDHLSTAALHWDRREHEVNGELGRGVVHSHHRQALTDAGSLRVIAKAPDGVIEAIVRDGDRPMYLGVQWHPERTADERLGRNLFLRLVEACKRPNG